MTLLNRLLLSLAKAFGKHINDGPEDLSEPLGILKCLQTARGPYGNSFIPALVGRSENRVEVTGIGGFLLLEFMVKTREVVDSVGGKLMLAERHGTGYADIDLLFASFTI